jgi:hypothetical protein
LYCTRMHLRAGPNSFGLTFGRRGHQVCGGDVERFGEARHGREPRIGSGF